MGEHSEKKSAPAKVGRTPRVAVIGGGITGLAAALRIVELVPSAVLTFYEAADRLGGVLETSRREGFLIERSADSFITKYPWAIDLCRRLGIEHELLPTDEKHRHALVVHDGQLHRVPSGFVLMTPNQPWPVLTSPILSWRGKLRLLAEPWMPGRTAATSGDESVGAFARRRLGDEAYERLVQPLLGGIHTADADHLSLAATFPEYMAQEQFHGRIQRTRTRRGESGARYGMFVAPRDGMDSLVQRIAQHLPTGVVRLATRVSALARVGDDWQLEINSQREAREAFHAVVLAVPAPAAASLLASQDPRLSADLARIEYASCAVVCLAYRRDQFRHPPSGFGFVVPKVESRSILAASFASEKFPDRAPPDQVLIRVFIGGAIAPELAELPDSELLDIAREELTSLMQISGLPTWSEVARWPKSMPQYHVGHLQRVAAIEAGVAEWPGLALAGNAYHGVGIPQCIRSGETAAEQIRTHLHQTAGG